MSTNLTGLNYTSVNNLSAFTSGLSSVSANKFIATSNGSALDPNFTWRNNLATGFYMLSDNISLGVSVDGKQTAEFNTSGIRTPLNVQALTFKFDEDNKNYLDYDTVGTRIRHIINGLTKFSVSDTLTGSLNPIHVTAGTVSNPALSFITDPDTGIYSSAANELGVTCGGLNALTLSSSLASFASEVRALKYSFSDSITSYIEFDNIGLSVDLYNGANLKLRIASAYSEHYNVLRNALGTVSNTSYSFIGDGGTGLYSSTIYNIDAACNGTRVLNLSSTGMKTANGSIGAPAYSFLGDTDTGIYLSGTNIMSFAAGGLQRMYIGPTDVTVNNRFFIDYLGTVANPSFSWATDTDTGFYRSAPNNFDITAGGTQALNINSGGIFVGVAGTAAAPSLSWIADTNTGFYNLSADAIGLTLGGSQQCTWTTANFTCNLTTYFPDGSVSVPSVSFTNDTNTGMFLSGIDAIGFACGGSSRLRIGPTSCDFVNKIRGQASDTAASPTFSWVLDSDTGMYNSATNSITFATNGIGRVTINTANLITDLPIIAAAGSATTPSYTFNSNTQTGFYLITTNTIGYTSNGILQVRFDPGSTILYNPIYTDIGTGAFGIIHYNLRSTSGIMRHGIGLSGTESGGNAGADLYYWRYSDAGGFLGNGFIVVRSSGTFLCNAINPYGNCSPGVDNAYNCGQSGQRWANVWANNGTIQTSDERNKENIEDSKLGLDFINQLRPVSYKWKDTIQQVKIYNEETGPEGKMIEVEKKSSRIRYGLIAQEVKTVLDDLKISTNDFGGYIDSSVNEPEKPQVLGLNYTEFIGPLIKAVQELSSALNALVARVESLEELPA